MGRALGDFIPPRSRELHEQHMAAFANGASRGGPMGPRDVTALRLDGTEFPIEANISRLETSRPPAGQYTRGDFDKKVDSAKKWSLISNVSFGVGIATLSVSAIFFYLGGKERADVPPPYAVAPTNGGAMIVRGVSW